MAPSLKASGAFMDTIPAAKLESFPGASAQPTEMTASAWGEPTRRLFKKADLCVGVGSLRDIGSLENVVRMGMSFARILADQRGKECPCG